MLLSVKGLPAVGFLSSYWKQRLCSVSGTLWSCYSLFPGDLRSLHSDKKSPLL